MSTTDPIHLLPPALAMEAEPLSESDITALLDDPTISVRDLVAGTADLEQENPAGHWRIGGPSEAEWAMRKYAEAAANLDLLNEQATPTSPASGTGMKQQRARSRGLPHSLGGTWRPTA